MMDSALLFVASLIIVICGLVVATAFALYLKFPIGQALETLEKKKVAEAPQRVTAPSVSEGALIR